MGEAVYIVCGGTGGHLAPGIATAQRLMEAGTPVQLVVSEKEVDSRLLQAYPEIPYRRERGAPFSWRPVGLCRFLCHNLHSFVLGMLHLRRTRPAVVVAFGGFLSVSYALAAWLLRIPLVLHEANRVPGRSIRFLAGIAERVYVPEGVHVSGVEPRCLRRLGMPVRREVSHIRKEHIRSEMGIPVHAKVLLVVGGSQGAQVLNEWVADHYKSLGADGIWVLLVTGPGKRKLPRREALDDDHGREVELRTFAFHSRMHELLSCADVVLGRAGAGTIAELAVCRVPSILIPYPHAADDHQTANARDLEQRGGCILIPQSRIHELYREVLDLIFNDWLLSRMRANLQRLVHGDAAEDLARDIIKDFLKGDGTPAQVTVPKPTGPPTQEARP
jgi:UDP-N-acetylglucosamine--N-acetylmuramyl-(pentapeptide) pyrophosphoryl-undecaprenol N-acetylglucosamine transferase